MLVSSEAETYERANVLYRQARHSDIPMMAEIRAADWGTEEYWSERILQYLTHKLHPRDALRPRVSFVCVEHQRVVGLIAGHLTRRFGCDGELEWISVRLECRSRGIASELLCRLAKWFVAHHARRVCGRPALSNARKSTSSMSGFAPEHWKVLRMSEAHADHSGSWAVSKSKGDQVGS